MTDKDYDKMIPNVCCEKIVKNWKYSSIFL